MKYNIKEEGPRVFYGVSKVIDLNHKENIPFSQIWDESAKEFNMKYFNPEYSPIGLEFYLEDFMETQQFTYSALLPINSEEGLNPKKIIRLEGGSFIRFETTFKELTQGFIPKAYQYIRDNDLPVSYGFDYEEYPPEFIPENPQSIVYVCWKYLG